MSPTITVMLWRGRGRSKYVKKIDLGEETKKN